MNELIINKLALFSEVLGWTLVHSLWQIGLVAIVLKIVLQFVPQRNATVKYGLSLFALLAIATWTAITFGQQLQAVDFTFSAGLEDTTIALPISEATPAPQAVDMESLINIVAGQLNGYLPLLSSIWLLGIGLLLVRLLLNYKQLHRLDQQYVQLPSAEWLNRMNRFCKQLGITRSVNLLLSERISEPITFRHFRPVILLPVSMMSGLTTAQIETLLLHELAHIRRHDYLTNLFQSVLEILFFFHPAVWWISRIVREEREHCCDDLVLRHQQHPMLYAEALLQIQANHYSLKTNLAMSAKGNHKPFTTRIQRLFGKYPTPNSIARGTLAVLLILGALSVFAFNLPDESLDNFAVEKEEITVQKDTSGQPEKVLVVVDLEGDKAKHIELITDKPVNELKDENIKTFLAENGVGVNNHQIKRIDIHSLDDANPNLAIIKHKNELEGEDRDRVVRLVEIISEGDEKVDTIVMMELEKQTIKTRPFDEENSGQMYVSGNLETGTLVFDPIDLRMDTLGHPEKKNVSTAAKVREESNLQPLYILDGKVVSKQEVEEVNSNNIKQVLVHKNEKAVERFGEKGRDGVVEIITKKGETVGKVNDEEENKSKVTVVGKVEKMEDDPLFIVDGEEYNRDLKTLEAKDIESVTVLKGDDATNKYGEKGSNGVVEITLKKKSFKKKSKQDGYETKIIISKKQAKLSEDALIILNGEEYNRPLESIDPENIMSVNVFKGEEAARVYGEKGENGVIEIVAKTRKSKETKRRRALIAEMTRPLATVTADEPLIILDGKVHQGNFQTIDRRKIATVNVIKDEKAIEKYGEEGKNGVIEITTKKGAKKANFANDTFKVFPNPSDDLVQIQGELQQDTRIIIEIWDMKGALVQELVNGTFQGNLGTKWNAKNATPGTYIVKITMDGKVSSQKVIIR
ncbi:MAG: M56 family metallopeptidase [Bacteroidota bacterium]